MIKIDKSYTIKFSKSGYNQYAYFGESEGKIINPRLFISYCRADEIPDISNLDNINDILDVIKSISYANKAEIYLINGNPVNYENNDEVKTYIDLFGERYDNFLADEILLFFNTILKPILIKNKWFISTSHIGFTVLIEKNEDGEWDNIKRNSVEFDFEYLCYCFARHFTSISVDLKNENGYPSVDGLSFILNKIPFEVYEQNGLFIKN